MHGLKAGCRHGRRSLVRVRGGSSSTRLFSSLLEFISSSGGDSSSSPAGGGADGGGKQQPPPEERQQPSSSVDSPPPPPQYDDLTSAFDTSRNWRDWFHPAEYDNPWDKTQYSMTRRFQFPLDHGPLDTAARHLIQLLQQFHRFENATTVQCNAVLTNLLQLSIGQPSIAERAVAILENMEMLEDTQRNMHSFSGGIHQHNRDDDGVDDNSSAMIQSMMRSSSSDVVEKVARPIPKPNRITVRMDGNSVAKQRATFFSNLSHTLLLSSLDYSFLPHHTHTHSTTRCYGSWPKPCRRKKKDPKWRNRSWRV
jgi:hypothetical protein